MRPSMKPQLRQFYLVLARLGRDGGCRTRDEIRGAIGPNLSSRCFDRYFVNAQHQGAIRDGEWRGSNFVPFGGIQGDRGRPRKLYRIDLDRIAVTLRGEVSVHGSRERIRALARHGDLRVGPNFAGVPRELCFATYPKLEIRQRTDARIAKHLEYLGKPNNRTEVRAFIDHLQRVWNGAMNQAAYVAPLLFGECMIVFGPAFSRWVDAETGLWTPSVWGDSAEEAEAHRLIDSIDGVVTSSEVLAERTTKTGRPPDSATPKRTSTTHIRHPR